MPFGGRRGVAVDSTLDSEVVRRLGVFHAALDWRMVTKFGPCRS